MNEALTIIDEAKNSKLTIRVMGAVGILYHCPTWRGLLIDESKFHRELSDLDLAAYSKHRGEIVYLFDRRGFKLDKNLMMDTWGERYTFQRIQDGLIVDVFFDKLDMCHTIDFRKDNRLEKDPYSLSPADLLLEKMQIVKIAEKDVKDVIVLLLEHEIGTDDNDKINISYINKILSKDWGFYYTVRSNLNKIMSLLPRYPFLEEKDKNSVKEKIARLLTEIEATPKSLSWKLRAAVGPKVRWYKEVEDRERSWI
jgi:hypothetical protein